MANETWWKIEVWNGKIEPVGVTRFTERNVWVIDKFNGKEYRVARVNVNIGYFSTREEAKANLHARLDRRIRHAEDDVRRAQELVEKEKARLNLFLTNEEAFK